MNADVGVQLAVLDLGTTMLEPFKPLQGRITLQDGVLNLKELLARTSAGEVQGAIGLDSRPANPKWNCRHPLERHPARTLPQDARRRGARGREPRRQARCRLHQRRAWRQRAAQGRRQLQREAAGVLDGTARMWVRDGTVSHILVEAAGIDVAQALGVFVKGDDKLPMQCALAKFDLVNGKVMPEVFVIDAWDTTCAGRRRPVAGHRVTGPAHDRASSRDFSPLALRTPVKVSGTFENPPHPARGRPARQRGGGRGRAVIADPLAALLGAGRLQAVGTRRLHRGRLARGGRSPGRGRARAATAPPLPASSPKAELRAAAQGRVSGGTRARGGDDADGHAGLLGTVLLAMCLLELHITRLPMGQATVYLAVGWVAGWMAQGKVATPPTAPERADMLVIITEIAVLISLFAVGLRLGVPSSLKGWRAATILASATMLVTIALATLAGAWLMPGLGWAGALLLGGHPRADRPGAGLRGADPLARRPRRRARGPSPEGGLDDGTALPVVMLALELLGIGQLGAHGVHWLWHDLAWPIAGGALLGWAFGGVSGKVLHALLRHGHGLGWDELLYLGIITVAYGLSRMTGTSSFLFVFAAALGLFHRSARATQHLAEKTASSGPTNSPNACWPSATAAAGWWKW